jgi:hypothetical protein
MVEPSLGDEQTPAHDPWAPTERVAPAPRPPALPPTRQYPYPGLAAQQPAPEAVILKIGDMEVTATSVRTPVGVLPLRGSQWHISDSWTTETKIPVWAIVFAIVGFFCMAFFSLLFLLARENVQRPVVTVEVTSGAQRYDARIQAEDQAEVQYLYQLVNYVRSLAAM